MTPQHPFSTILAATILQMIRARDLELVGLQNSFRADTISLPDLTRALKASEAKIADDVLEVCTRNLATLEATVDTVLQLQAQMQILREAQ